MQRRDILGLTLGAAALTILPQRLRATASSSEAQGTVLDYSDVRALGLPLQRLSIWLPPDYATSSKRYRVLYMHDAQNLFDPALSNFNKVWAADRAMMQHAQARGDDPWIIVGIWSPGVGRYRQYLPAPAYAAATGTLRATMDEYAKGPIISYPYIDWLAGPLKGWVDRSFRTRPGRDDTAIIGSSMGGLISLYAFLEYSKVYGRAGCVSTHWPAIAPQKVGETNPELVAIWTGMLTRKLGAPEGRKLWFDHGTGTLDAFYPPYQAAIDALMQATPWVRGRDWESRQYPGAEHEENAWAARLPEVLDWVLA